MRTSAAIWACLTGRADFGDGGRVLVDNRRRQASLRPSMSFELSPRRELQFGAGYTDVSFEEQISSAQVGYQVTDLSAGLVTRLNERSSLITRLRGARYDIDTLDVTESYGGEVEWSTRTAAETRTYLRAGAQNVELQSGDSELAWLAGAGVSLIMGRNELFADLSRNVGPSSIGLIVARDQLRVRPDARDDAAAQPDRRPAWHPRRRRRQRLGLRRRAATPPATSACNGAGRRNSRCASPTTTPGRNSATTWTMPPRAAP